MTDYWFLGNRNNLRLTFSCKCHLVRHSSIGCISFKDAICKISALNWLVGCIFNCRVELWTYYVYYPTCFRATFKPRDICTFIHLDACQNTSRTQSEKSANVTKHKRGSWVMEIDLRQQWWCNNKDNKSHDPVPLMSFVLFRLRDP